MALPVSKLTGSKRAAEIEEQRKQERDRRAAAAAAAANRELQKAWVGKFEAWAKASEDELDRLQQREFQTQRDLLQEESQLQYLAMQTSAEDCCMENLTNAFQTFFDSVAVMNKSSGEEGQTEAGDQGECQAPGGR